MTDLHSDGRSSPVPVERPRPSWRDFRHRYPAFLVAVTIALVAMIALDSWLVYRRLAYSAEIHRLRENMSDAEREKTDVIVASEESKIRLAIELARRQARLDNRLHLSIPVDSGLLYLEREGAILREVGIEVGAEKTVGVAPDTIRMAVPRGERTVREVLVNDSWAIPEWVYADRGVAPEPERTRVGALGPIAIVLEGGAIIYSMPSTGPLADSLYVLPGSVRAPVADLEALAASVEPGMKVYFY